MIQYFEKTKPASWNLKDALKAVKALHPDKEFSLHLLKLERDLQSIANNHKKQGHRDAANYILSNWTKLAPSQKDVYALYQTEGSPAGGNDSTLNVGTLVNNIDYLEQQNIGTSGPSYVQGKQGKRKAPEQNNNDNDGGNNNIKDNDSGLFLDDENNITLKKKSKVYNYLGLQQYTTSPNKPRLDDDDSTTLKQLFDIVLSGYHASSSSPQSTHIYNDNMEDQLNNRSLNHVPDALKFLDEVLKQPLDDLLQYLWANGYEGCTDEELSVNKMIRYILTDFHLNCTITTNNDNERTPFCQRFIPIFKAFAGVTRLMDFTWCEKGLLNNRFLSLCLPKSILHRALLDGIGMSVNDKTERLLIESSGDDSGHTEEDTLKQINNTSHCLKMDLARYKHASFDTFLKRQVFGIQFIHDKMTLTSSRLISPTRYAFIEVRSAVIPTNYAHRCSWVKVFELLLKLKHDLIEQEKVTYLLERENVGLVKVDLTVKDALH